MKLGLYLNYQLFLFNIIGFALCINWLHSVVGQSIKVGVFSFLCRKLLKK